MNTITSPDTTTTDNTAGTATAATDTAATTTDAPTLHRPETAGVMRAIAKRSYCTLATVSEAGRPHAAGVLYELVDDTMWINTLDSSRKARDDLPGSCFIRIQLPRRLHTYGLGMSLYSLVRDPLAAAGVVER